MRHKKLKLSALLMLVLGLTVLQAQNLYVMDKTGLQTEITISDIGKITFSDGNIVIDKTDGTQSFSMTDLRYVNFENLATSSPMYELQDLDEMPLLYPNPVEDMLYFKLNTSEFENAYIEILSLDGRVVLKELMQDDTNLHQTDVSSLHQGLYLCRILNRNKSKTVKFYKN